MGHAVANGFKIIFSKSDLDPLITTVFLGHGQPLLAWLWAVPKM